MTPATVEVMVKASSSTCTTSRRTWALLTGSIRVIGGSASTRGTDDPAFLVSADNPHAFWSSRIYRQPTRGNTWVRYQRLG